MGTTKSRALVNVCKVCGKVGICAYITFASTWICTRCYKEWAKLLAKRFPDLSKGVKHSDAMKLFKEFCKPKKEKVVFT